MDLYGLSPSYSAKFKQTVTELCFYKTDKYNNSLLLDGHIKIDKVLKTPDLIVLLGDVVEPTTPLFNSPYNHSYIVNNHININDLLTENYYIMTVNSYSIIVSLDLPNEPIDMSESISISNINIFKGCSLLYNEYKFNNNILKGYPISFTSPGKQTFTNNNKYQQTTTYNYALIEKDGGIFYFNDNY